MSDKRSRERAAQHGPHGWRRRAGFEPDDRGRVLMECPCGWLGWVEP